MFFYMITIETSKPNLKGKNNQFNQYPRYFKKVLKLSNLTFPCPLSLTFLTNNDLKISINVCYGSFNISVLLQ